MWAPLPAPRRVPQGARDRVEGRAGGAAPASGARSVPCPLVSAPGCRVLAHPPRPAGAPVHVHGREDGHHQQHRRPEDHGQGFGGRLPALPLRRFVHHRARHRLGRLRRRPVTWASTEARVRGAPPSKGPADVRGRRALPRGRRDARAARRLSRRPPFQGGSPCGSVVGEAYDPRTPPRGATHATGPRRGVGRAGARPPLCRPGAPSSRGRSSPRTAFPRVVRLPLRISPRRRRSIPGRGHSNEGCRRQEPAFSNTDSIVCGRWRKAAHNRADRRQDGRATGRALRGHGWHGGST